MNKPLLFAVCLLLSVAACGQPDSAIWQRLNARPYPQWFSDSKLGIFIHWGLYSVPAYASKEGYAEWLYRGLLSGDSARRQAMSHYADTSLDVHHMYAQLTNHWHAELWNPDEWAALFAASGAKYVMLVTKHHDGYSLWDDPLQPNWNSLTSGPHRNIVAELTQSVRKQGLRMCFYYSLPEWSNPLHRWTIDPDSAISTYVDQYMTPQFKHLVLHYRPDAIFADGDWDFTPDQFHSPQLIDWYYQTIGPDAIVNDRWGRGTPHGFRTPEYSAGIADTSRPWAECRGIGRSFGLNRNEDLDGYLTNTQLIQHFCELVAHGGGLTLNVGPSADGHIPLIQQERLLALGHWLQVNGQAIYQSHPLPTPCHRQHTSAPLPTSPIIDFDWVRNAPLKEMPIDHFEVRWEGYVDGSQMPHSQCLLRIEGDNEIYLIDAHSDTLLYFNHDWAENNRAQCLFQFSPDSLYHFSILLKEKDLECTAHLWASFDQGKTYLPLQGTWQGKALWNRTTRCFTQQGGNLYIIEFERPGSHLLIPDLPPIPRHSTITLLGTSSPIKWKQLRNGTLQLDLSSLPAHQLNALHHAWVFQIHQP